MKIQNLAMQSPACGRALCRREERNMQELIQQGLKELNIENAMAQSKRDAKESEKPVVMHRKNRHMWLVTMPFDEWIELYQAWEKTL